MSTFWNVFGPLAGVILGYYLNVFGRRGKIVLYINSINYEMLQYDGAGAFKSIDLPDEASDISIDIDIDAFNTSFLSPLIARDIYFVIESRGTTIFKDRIIDNSTRKNTGYRTTCDKLNHINIRPREIINLNLSVSFSKNIPEALKGIWKIVYMNHKNQIKSSIIIRNYE